MDRSLIAAAATELGVSNLSRLAEGGQKYVAVGTRAGLTVVVKVVEIGSAHAGVTLERAEREVDLLRRINHPNVVRALSELRRISTGGAQGATWLEEYLEGEDLETKLNVPWDWSTTETMASEVARGLSALHSEHAVHRDLSPKNIRCLRDGTFKIMDPGLARHLERSSLTGFFQPGTPGYMTPEHVAGLARPIPASDVFGVGILMYKALTGDLPFPIGTDFDAYRTHLRDGQASRIQTVRSDLSDEQATIVDTCLQRQSGRRYLDGSELASALEAL
jgi:serine/threonine-protein kinase